MPRRQRRDRAEGGSRARARAPIAALLFLFASAAFAAPDIPSEPVDWLLDPPETLVRERSGEIDAMIALCEEMGWTEKEYALREARLRERPPEGEARAAEEKRIASLALRTGRSARALELLGDPDPGDAEGTLLAGIVALRSGKNREASHLLRAAEDLGAADRDLVRFRRAEALRSLPEADYGIPLLLEIAAEPSGRFRIDALEEAALALFRRKEPEKALPLLLREYGAGYESLKHRELIYRTAEAERETGRAAAAASLHRRLLEEWPEHPRALESFRALRRMETAGTIPHDPRLPLLGARAAARAGRTDEAIQLLRPLLDRPEPDPLRLEALLETGKVHYQAERYRSALRVLDPLAAGSGETARTALLYRARSFRKMGEWTSSIEAYTAYARRFPTSSLAPEAQWEVAWRRKLLRHHEEAAKAFREVRVLFPESEYAARAPLQEALSLDALGRTREARAIVEEHLRGGVSGSDRVEALYWVADLAGRLGDSARAESAFRELAEKHPETYYGLRAASKLGKTVILSPSRIAEAAERDDPMRAWIREWSPRRSGTAGLDFGRLALYASLAEGEEARREAASLRKSLEDDPEGLLDLARACRRLALFDELIRCGRRIQALAERAGADSVFPHLLALIYPPAYLDLIAAECAKWEEIDPFFVLSLMRQESWFQPNAVSSAGARGLMQILPSTGKHIARSLGEGDSFRAERLDEPERNIRYGVWYLRSLLRRYGGDAVVAASAYNAGEGSADTWVAAAGDEGPDRYVEKITFSETRTYVKRILSGYWICRAIYDEIATRGFSG
ncbi:MAG: transglycosylase SLT domain-containing protein [Candidatus Eisenbacteria bacterium]|nr:transglycosylase SLT domain-containing protein [Candidatus Eisenbacteria bacterium]